MKKKDNLPQTAYQWLCCITGSLFILLIISCILSIWIRSFTPKFAATFFILFLVFRSISLTAKEIEEEETKSAKQ